MGNAEAAIAYPDAAPDYWRAGWHGPIPLPHRSKDLKLVGITGYGAPYLSWPDVMAYSEEWPHGNLAIRLPHNVVVIDVDHYDQKRGADTLADLIDFWGPLPDTWRNSARDYPSGQLFFRAPEGMQWKNPGPSIEVLHAGWRYAVAWPSINPHTGTQYHWYEPDEYNPEGKLADRLPTPDDLPELPDLWIAGMTGGLMHTDLPPVQVNDGVPWLLERHYPGDCPVVRGSREKALADVAGADVHDATLRGPQHLVRLAEHGHRGAVAALLDVEEKWLVAAQNHPVPGHQRTPNEARREWERGIKGAIGKVLAQPEITGIAEPCDCGLSVEDLVDRSPAQSDDFFAEELPPAPGNDSLGEDVPEATPEELIAAAKREELNREVNRLRLQRDARARLAAEDQQALRRLDFDNFLDSPKPEALVPDLLYHDTLSRVFGAPGCGKSFVALDIAMRVALGWPWPATGNPETAEQGTVHYVMAEGQAVNVARTEAWLNRHGATREALRERFVAFPDAVLLTEEGIKPYLREVELDKPRLIILDTKNAMMDGDEDRAAEVTVLRRALDALRKVSGAAVLLIDHTGLSHQERGRGSNALTAAVDTEFRVVKDDDDKPPLIKVEVTRDKAAEPGRAWHFRLRMEHPAAVLVALTPEEVAEQAPKAAGDDWKNTVLPAALATYAEDGTGRGKLAVPDLARFMTFYGSERVGDPGLVGVSRPEAIKAMAALGYDRMTVQRAWSTLIDRGNLEPAEGVKAPTGRHLWNRV